MALSKDTGRKSRGVGIQDTIAIGTGSTAYVGSLAVRRTTTGRALAGTAATGRRVLGVIKRLDSDVNGPGAGSGVGNTAGTQKALIEYGNEHLFAIKTAIRTNTSLGLNVFVADDETVGGTAVGTAATRVNAGRLTRFEASDKSTGWVAVAEFGPVNIAV